MVKIMIFQRKAKAYWLIKSEPSTWSFEDQKAKGEIPEPWNGVRNYQARNYMKQMNKGDLCFFYHSVKEKRIMGIVEVASDYRLDETDETGMFGLRDMRYVFEFKRPITLDEIKKNPLLETMVLLKQSRLSIQPVTADEWDCILKMAEES